MTLSQGSLSTTLTQTTSGELIKLGASMSANATSHVFLDLDDNCQAPGGVGGYCVCAFFYQKFNTTDSIVSWMPKISILMSQHTSRIRPATVRHSPISDRQATALIRPQHAARRTAFAARSSTARARPPRPVTSVGTATSHSPAAVTAVPGTSSGTAQAVRHTSLFTHHTEPATNKSLDNREITIA